MKYLQLFEGYLSGFVFILTLEYLDGKKRLWYSPVVSIQKSEAENQPDKVIINPKQMYWVRSYGTDFREVKYEFNQKQLKEIFNMDGLALPLIYKKCPFYKETIKTDIYSFFRKNKQLIRDLENQGVSFEAWENK